jgi:hypothetical protein
VVAHRGADLSSGGGGLWRIAVAKPAQIVEVDDLGALLAAPAEQLARGSVISMTNTSGGVLQRAVQCRAVLDLVRRAIGLEDDQPMAESMVISVLEVPAPGE